MLYEESCESFTQSCILYTEVQGKNDDCVVCNLVFDFFRCGLMHTKLNLFTLV